MGKDRNPDDVSTYPADQHDLDSYRHASSALSKLQVPVLVHASNPHEQLYVATFDGTGNSMYKDAPENRTNVALLYEQIQAANKRGLTNIGAGYVEGPGTQEGFLDRSKDLITGASFEARVEEMYKQFVDQAKTWLKEDPKAQISLAITGFSRGAEQAAAFAVLVHERGIQDPEGAKYTRNKDNQITHVEYTNPPLVNPGQIAQTVGLFDPVGTGEPRQHNRTLPTSVISGFQITAEDERRDQFKSTNIIDAGFSEQNHFLNVTVGGAHSDIGNGYLLNGIGIRSGNLMIDYFNGLSDRPFLAKLHEPTDPKLNVVHRSEEHQRLIYTTRNFERNQQRSRIEEVDNPVLCQRGVKRNCWNKDAYDRTLDQKFEQRPVPIMLPPAAPAGGVHERASNKAQTHDAPQLVIPTPVSLPARDFRDEDHPQHVRYTQTLVAVHAMESQRNIAPGSNSERIAASFVDQMHKEGFQELARMEFRGNGSDTRIVAVPIQFNPWNEKKSEVALDPNQALARSVEQSSAAWAARALPHLQQPATRAETQTSSRVPSELSEHDLRNPQHPEHSLYANVRGQVESGYAAVGLPRTQEQLEQTTAAVALNMRRNNMTHAEALILSPDPKTGVIGANSTIIVLQSEQGDPLKRRAVTLAHDLQRPSEESYQQMTQVTQQQTIVQTLAHQREDRVQQRGNGMVMG